MLKLSIIIPIYNVEKYIRKCIESCLMQNVSSDEYELILVNDGSPDNSLTIAKEVASEATNITIISKENGGLSSARNTGLEKAKGEYVWFLDSDDRIELNCLRDIFDRLNNIEVLILDTYFAYEDKPTLKAPIHKLKVDAEYSGFDAYFSGYHYPYSGAPFYVFQRTFLLNNHLDFEEGILFEDLLFITKIFVTANRCQYYNNPVYYYLMRPGSIVNSSVTVKSCRDLLVVADKLNDLVQYYREDNARVIYDSIARIAGTFYRYRWKKLNKEERVMMAKEFKQKKYWISSILKSYRYKYLIHYYSIR